MSAEDIKKLALAEKTEKQLRDDIKVLEAQAERLEAALSGQCLTPHMAHRQLIQLGIHCSA